jgi:hypothetical protein
MDGFDSRSFAAACDLFTGAICGKHQQPAGSTPVRCFSDAIRLIREETQESGERHRLSRVTVFSQNNDSIHRVPQPGVEF